jgi:hypothetical protein
MTETNSQILAFVGSHHSPVHRKSVYFPTPQLRSYSGMECMENQSNSFCLTATVSRFQSELSYPIDPLLMRVL